MHTADFERTAALIEVLILLSAYSVYMYIPFALWDILFSVKLAVIISSDEQTAISEKVMVHSAKKYLL